MKSAGAPRPECPGSAPASDPKLTVQCFAIYSGNPACGRTYKLVLEELGLTYTQSISIAALSKENNQTVTGLGQKLCWSRTR